ncbi:MAG: AlpA family phage regulatory protein, partial [Roseibium sp.]|nr:AlpA family phage regulatory protein [Roseibium sp.]
EPLTMLKLSEVIERVGLSSATIYRHMDSGKFPLSVEMGGSVRWYEHEIQEYLANRPRKKNKAVD